MMSTLLYSSRRAGSKPMRYDEPLGLSGSIDFGFLRLGTWMIAVIGRVHRSRGSDRIFARDRVCTLFPVDGAAAPHYNTSAKV